MSLKNSGARRHDKPLRRQQQPPPSNPSHFEESYLNGDATMGVSFFFRGVFDPGVQEAIERAIGDFEQALEADGEQDTQWLVMNIGPEDMPSFAATRLTDGRTFRSRTQDRLIESIRAAINGDVNS
jgi:hypothetical protein